MTDQKPVQTIAGSMSRRIRFSTACANVLQVLLSNTRRRSKADQLLTIGTLNANLSDSREVFRGQMIAAAIVLMQNHRSDGPTLSDVEIKLTRDQICVGQLMKTDVLDHLLMGNSKP